MGAVRDLLVRERETPSRQIAQSGGVSKDLNARLAVPDHDIATLRRDNHSMQVLHIGRCGEGVTARSRFALMCRGQGRASRAWRET